MFDKDYPNGPGFYQHAPSTSAEAAVEVAEAAATRERRAREWLRKRGPVGGTADEAAEALEWERYSSRPRLSTMKKRGEIVANGERRPGASGRSQSVWILAEFAPQPPPGSQGELPGINR